MIPPAMLFDHFFAAGGMGMYPISICGFLLVAASVVLMLRPERRYIALVGMTALMTLGSGALGFLAGLANLLHYMATVAPAEQRQIAILGTAEALHCVIYALFFLQAAFWLAAIAALRASRKQAAVSSLSRGPCETVG